MTKSKSIAELKAENHLLRKVNGAESWASVIKEAIRCLTVFGIFYLGYLAISSLAGKTTLTNIVINLLGSLTVSQQLSYVFGAGGIIYGYIELRLRQKTVIRLQSRNKLLEESIDHSRTSSKLTLKGETNSQDKEE